MLLDAVPDKIPSHSGIYFSPEILVEWQVVLPRTASDNLRGRV